MEDIQDIKKFSVPEHATLSRIIMYLETASPNTEPLNGTESARKWRREKREGGRERKRKDGRKWRRGEGEGVREREEDGRKEGRSPGGREEGREGGREGEREERRKEGKKGG